MTYESTNLTPDDKAFWIDKIAEFLALNDGKMELADLELPPIGNYGGLGKFFQVFGENAYKREFAVIVAHENTRRTGEPWVVFNYCEGGAYRPNFLRTPTAMLFAEADKFIKDYEPKIRKMYDGGFDRLDYTIYYKRGDNEVCTSNDRYDIGDSKKVSGLYNVLLAETDFYYSHPEIYKWKTTDENFASYKELAYADIAILKKAIITEYPYIEIEIVIRYADGDKLDQKVFNKGEILPFSEADGKIKREEKTMREQYIKKYGYPGNGDEELGIAVHFRLSGESEPSVFRVSYLLGDYDEERGGLLKHFEMGATYYNACIRNGDYDNVNVLLGGQTADDAIRLALKYNIMYENLLKSMNDPKEITIIEQTGDGCESENKLESDFLLTTRTNMFGIYQVRDDLENARDMRFASFDELGQRGIEPNRSDYKLVYAAPFSDRIEFLTDRQPVLNRLFKQFNIDHPPDFTGRSMSMSDVVVLRYNGDMSAHYVDYIGFIELNKVDFYK